MKYAIIGRIDGDDEDTCEIVEAANPAQAHDDFCAVMRDQLKENLGVDDLSAEDLSNNRIYVNHILVSPAGDLEVVNLRAMPKPG